MAEHLTIYCNNAEVTLCGLKKERVGGGIRLAVPIRTGPEAFTGLLLRYCHLLPVTTLYSSKVVLFG